MLNLGIEFSASFGDPSTKAIIVECGDISKFLVTSKGASADSSVEEAIFERFGSDFNRAEAILNSSFPLEIQIRASVCDSILESRGKLLLADQVERSWYRRKVLALADGLWTDNVTVHWTGFEMEIFGGGCLHVDPSP